jgi:ankyrin repeat protein
VEVVQGVLASAKAREAAGGEGVGAVAALMAPNPVNGDTPLYEASVYGHAAVVEALLAHEATEVNQAETDTGSTPLYMASHNGHAAVVEALLRHSAIKVDQAMTDGNGTTPLIRAAIDGRQQCVELLLDAGADRTIAMTGSTYGGYTAGDWAKQQGHESIVALLDR